LISATLDSSVYIRALHFGGTPALLIGHARAGTLRIDISDPILNETLRVLRDKFEWNGYMLQDIRGKLLSMGNHVVTSGNLAVIKEDPDDDRMRDSSEFRFHRDRGQRPIALGAIRQLANRHHSRFVKLCLPETKRR
jgi:hypothetical protein